MDAILSHESSIRLSVFLLTFGSMALWEALSPWRELQVGRVKRWPTNLLVAALNSFVVRLISPGAVVGFAWTVSERHWGFFNHLALPSEVAVVASVLALDGVIYAQHVLFHRLPVLWRFHRVHHADLDVDVTTGARFHPVEIVLSLLLKFGAVALLGAPPLGVLTFEILLNSSSLFNHSNVRMPVGLEKVLRFVLVTPDMHRVHHSVVVGETNSNFGFCLAWWDRLLRTYRHAPTAGPNIVIGLPQYRDRRTATVGWLLTSPFV